MSRLLRPRYLAAKAASLPRLPFAYQMTLQAPRSASNRSTNRSDRLHPSDAAVKEALPTLEARRTKSELRIAFLRKTLVKPWDELDEQKKELHAWKAELRAEAKARHERHAEEQKKVSWHESIDTFKRTRS